MKYETEPNSPTIGKKLEIFSKHLIAVQIALDVHSNSDIFIPKDHTIESAIVCFRHCYFACYLELDSVFIWFTNGVESKALENLADGLFSHNYATFCSEYESAEFPLPYGGNEGYFAEPDFFRQIY